MHVPLHGTEPLARSHIHPPADPFHPPPWPLPLPMQSYNLSLCPAQVRQGQWMAAVYNPRPTMALAFNLTVHKVGRCLHACSGHGR